MGQRGGIEWGCALVRHTFFAGQAPPEPAHADLPALLAALEGEGLRGLALEHLQQLPLVRQAARLERFRHQRGQSELRRLAAVLPAPTLVLKGGALQTRLYAPGQRTVRDFDLLVRPQDLARTQAALPPPAPAQARLAHFDLDLHHDPLHQAAGLFPFRCEEWWSHCRPLQGQLYVLDSDYELLLGLVHAAKHGFSRMIWLVDLALLLREQDPQPFLALVRCRGLTRILEWCLFLQREFFGLRLGPPWDDLGLPWARRGWLEKRLLEKVLQRQAQDYEGRLFLLLALPWWKRPGYAWRLAFPQGVVWARLGFLGSWFLSFLRRPSRDGESPPLRPLPDGARPTNPGQQWHDPAGPE